MVNGQDAQFQAEMTNPEQDIVCHVFCEEIGLYPDIKLHATYWNVLKYFLTVGIGKNATLKLDIDPSLFPKKQLVQQQLRFPTKESRILLSDVQTSSKKTANYVKPTESGSGTLVNKPWKPPSWNSINSNATPKETEEFDDAIFDRERKFIVYLFCYFPYSYFTK